MRERYYLEVSQFDIADHPLCVFDGNTVEEDRAVAACCALKRNAFVHDRRLGVVAGLQLDDVAVVGRLNRVLDGRKSVQRRHTIIGVVTTGRHKIRPSCQRKQERRGSQTLPPVRPARV